MNDQYYDEIKFEQFEEEDFFKSTIDLENTIPEIDSKTSFKKDKFDESNQNDIESNRSGYVFSSIKTLFTNYFYSKSKQEATNTYTNKIPGITTIRKYFDVELDEIKEKLKYSLMPYSPKFQQLAERNPDLYGPFWIFATLVYIVAVAGNISNYIDSTTKDDFRYEFDFIPSSAFYIYGLGFGFPILLTSIMKFFLSEISFVLIICYYGYSFTILAPILVLCIIPSHIVKWLLLSYAIGSSTTFLVYNIWKEISKYLDKNRYYVILTIVAFQMFLLFVLKTQFFKI